MIVNQWVPAAHRGDAIGDSARRVMHLLRGMGHHSDIFAMTIDDDLRGEVRPFTDPDARQGDLTIFHFALVSAMTPAFASLPGGRVLQYHNVTPAHFFAPYEPGIFRLAEVYKRYVDSYYRFIFVGRYDGLPRYYAQIRALIDRFQMLPDRFWFTGPVPDEDLGAFYRWADVYVSLSEHEGFCVPLVEAMAADVPVLAYAAGAVPETLGGAGVLFAPKDLEFAAEMLGMLVYDRPVREAVLDGQRRRLQAFAPAAIDARLGEVLERITG